MPAVRNRAAQGRHHRLPCRLQERGNSNRTHSNKLVRVKAFYAAQLDLKITRKDVPRPTSVEKVPEIYSAEDLEKFFEACDARQRLYFPNHPCLAPIWLRRR
jgi:integrase